MYSLNSTFDTSKWFGNDKMIVIDIKHVTIINDFEYLDLILMALVVTFLHTVECPIIHKITTKSW